MDRKIQRNRFWVNEFLKLKGITDYRIDERQIDKPDVGVFVDDKRIGIEVTEYFWATSRRVGREIESLKNNQVSAMWGDTSPDRFVKQIKDKIKEAKGYDRHFDELWLLVVFQGGLATQFLHRLYLGNKWWKLALQKLHEELTKSLYDSVCLYFHSDKLIKEWHWDKGWEEMTYKNQSENDYSFFWKLTNNIPFDPRSGKFLIKDEDDETAEWFKDPVGKARKEAYKAIEELRLRK